MILQDTNKTPLPTTVQLNPLGDGITVFATNDNGVPLACLWTLKSSGRFGPSYFGTLRGFTTNQVFVDNITIGPSFSAQYLPPDPALYKTNIHAVLTAVPTNGAAQRSIQLSVQRPNTGEWS
jgi:hypothetical protein